MLMAPVLAVVMALVIAGAVTIILPLNQPDESEAYLTTSGIGGVQATAAPQAAASAADLYTLPTFILIGVAAVIVGLAVVLLFFRKEPQ
jgi:hypothetical protein